MSPYVRYAPWAALATGILYVLMVMIPPSSSDDALHLDEWGRIPILHKGRIKPLDTLARTHLTIISGKESYTDKEDKRHSAVEWLLDIVTTGTHPTKEHLNEFENRPVFTITNPELLDLLKLKPKKDFRYSINDLGGWFEKILQVGAQLARLNPKELDDRSAPILELAQEFNVYLRTGPYATSHRVFRIEHDQVLSILGLERREGLRYALDEFVANLPRLAREVENAKETNDREHAKFVVRMKELLSNVQLFASLASLDLDTLRVVPTNTAGDREWLTYHDARQISGADASGTTPVQQFDSMLDAYRKKDVQGFNKAVDSYQAVVDARFPKEVRLASFETAFNHFAPFKHCEILYLAVGVLSILAWLIWPQPLVKSATLLALLTLVVHTGALLARMYIQGRPPVTNLYSSAIFVGWGCLGLALILERIYGNGIGNVVAAVLGFITTFFANYLSESGDTLEMLQAVLDTNFWLATHVVCIALGYTATGVAGVLGLLYVILGVATPKLDQPMRKSLAQMIYGVVCFAMLLSFVGTVLGGIWADQSWGRFWGWDPKENGAVLIVIWNALILHARWAGLVKPRGMALLAIAGNMVVGWSWIGTNQLGVGLHAYGFNNTLAKYLVISWIVHLVVLGAGLIPTRYWLSFNVPEVPGAAGSATRPSSYSAGSQLQLTK
jgi:ABC-type transport system involved in cytochrome c biogenesis permease subunit